MIDRWNNPIRFGVARYCTGEKTPSRQPDRHGRVGDVHLEFKLSPVTYEVKIVAGKVTLEAERVKEVESNTGAA